MQWLQILWWQCSDVALQMLKMCGRTVPPGLPKNPARHREIPAVICDSQLRRWNPTSSVVGYRNITVVIYLLRYQAFLSTGRLLWINFSLHLITFSHLSLIIIIIITMVVNYYCHSFKGSITNGCTCIIGIYLQHLPASILGCVLLFSFISFWAYIYMIWW